MSINQNITRIEVVRKYDGVCFPMRRSDEFPNAFFILGRNFEKLRVNEELVEFSDGAKGFHDGSRVIFEYP